MHRVFVFLVDRGFHFVAGNTKSQRVGGFHGGIDPAPENHAQRDKHDDGKQGISLAFHESKLVEGLARSTRTDLRQSS